MAGGFGTRLRPLTNNLPKPMVPMANRPIMEYIVELLKKHKITELTSLLYFQPESITGHLGDGSAFGVNMDYITATIDLGTEGGNQINIDESTTASLGIAGVDLSTQAGAAAAIDQLDTAAQQIDQNRAALGAHIVRGHGHPNGPLKPFR